VIIGQPRIRGKSICIGDETILLVSVVEHAATRGHGREMGQTRVTRSKDGIYFTLGKENFIDVQSGESP